MNNNIAPVRMADVQKDDRELATTVEVHDAQIKHLERDSAESREALLSLARDMNQLVRTVGAIDKMESRLDSLERTMQDTIRDALQSKIDAQRELLTETRERRRTVFSEVVRTLFAIAVALLLYHWGVH